METPTSRTGLRLQARIFPLRLGSKDGDVATRAETGGPELKGEDPRVPSALKEPWNGAVLETVILFHRAKTLSLLLKAMTGLTGCHLMSVTRLGSSQHQRRNSGDKSLYYLQLGPCLKAEI